tara:strand:+ start:1990 stop:2724 length:735 start_codon:yes stop_codon:yes gene_type:complete
MREYKVKGRLHSVYDSVDELPSNIKYVDDWRGADIGQWVLADDGCIIQILRSGQLKRAYRKKDVNYVGTCTGTFICSDAYKMDTDRRDNIYNLSGKTPQDSVKERKELTPKEQLFAQFVSQGMKATDAYLTAFDAKSKDYAHASAGLLLKQERIRTAMKESLKPVLEKLQINDSMVLSGIKDVAVNGEKDSDKLKALFELADILEIKETKKEVTAIGGAVFKGFLPEDTQVVEKRKDLLGDSDA